jgi:hypothetical protein
MKQLDAQTEMPCALATHAPAQQSASPVHGKSGGRHAPGPTSHRFDAGSHTPEQQSLPCAHRSAVRRHAVSSATQLPLSQWLEQQSMSSLHPSPIAAHTVEVQ